MAPLYLVDGFNLLHAVVLRGRERRDWWRVEQQARVVALARGFRGSEVWVVFDARGEERVAVTDTGGAFTPGTSGEQVQVRFAPNADDYIVELCAELEGQRHVVVVSADRALVDRARHRGAARLSPWQFAEQCGPTAAGDKDGNST
jgi:predicted RNA-binding protein with PIN domain